MGNFKKGGFSPKGEGFGRNDFNKRSSFGGKSSFKRFDDTKRFDDKRGGGSRSEMFKTVCDKCGKSCEVPFRPNGEKPVYCNECFGGKGEYSQRPTFSKPVQHSAPSVRVESDKRIDELKREVELMHAKIDLLIDVVGQQPEPVKPITKKEISKPNVSVKKVVKKVSPKKAPAKKKGTKK